MEYQKKIQFQEKGLVKLHKDLKTHRYRLDPSKRVAMPKLNGGTRYLGIKKNTLKGAQTCQYEGCDASDNLEEHHINPQVNI
jgi:hypothetical protein